MKIHKICWLKKKRKIARKGTAFRRILGGERREVDIYAQDQYNGSWSVTPTVREKTFHATKGWRDRLVGVGTTRLIRT